MVSLVTGSISGISRDKHSPIRDVYFNLNKKLLIKDNEN